MQPSGEQVICLMWVLSFAVEHEKDNTKFKSKFQEMSEFDSCAQNTMLTQCFKRFQSRIQIQVILSTLSRKYKDSAYFKAFEFYFLQIKRVWDFRKLHKLVMSKLSAGYLEATYSRSFTVISTDSLGNASAAIVCNTWEIADTTGSSAWLVGA